MHCTDALGPALGCAAHLARGRLDARLSQYDVTPAQTHVLLYLHRKGGQSPQRELTAYMKVKPSTANGILDRMVEKGLVARRVSDADARSRLIILTDKGRERQAQFHKNFLEVEELMVHGLSQQEREQFCSLLGRVIHNLEEDRTL